MADRAFGDEIRQLVDEEVPMAPWLEDRVMASVRVDAAGRSARRLHRRRPQLVMAGLAAAIIAVLAVAVLVGTRLVEHPTSSPASKPSPSRNAAVISYQAVISRDMQPVNSNDGLICKSRQQCVAMAMIARTAAETLLHDVESTPPPTSLAPAAAQLKTAVQQYIPGLDAYIAAVQDPSTNYLAPTVPSTNDLDLAVAAVVCWPGGPDVASGDKATGYSCTVQPPG